LIQAKKQIRRAKEDEKKLSDTKNQCCGSGSAWIRIHFGQLDPNPDPHWEYRSGSGSRRAKITHKSKENSSFGVTDVSDVSALSPLWRGGLGISKLQF
jgi:hypothetical protein